ncbi:hypothetical protein ACM26X_19775, partial [Kluyvera cryocrescens]
SARSAQSRATAFCFGIISACSILGQLCQDNPGIAVCVTPESVPALVEGIEQALMMPKQNAVARDWAERALDKEHVLNQFIADIRG